MGRIRSGWCAGRRGMARENSAGRPDRHRRDGGFAGRGGRWRGAGKSGGRVEHRAGCANCTGDLLIIEQVGALSFEWSGRRRIEGTRVPPLVHAGTRHGGPGSRVRAAICSPARSSPRKAATPASWRGRYRGGTGRDWAARAQCSSRRSAAGMRANFMARSAVENGGGSPRCVARLRRRGLPDFSRRAGPGDGRSWNGWRGSGRAPRLDPRPITRPGAPGRDHLRRGGVSNMGAARFPGLQRIRLARAHWRKSFPPGCRESPG